MYEPIQKLNKDLRNAATTLTQDEVRFLVDSYYQMQENRKRSDNQVRALSESGEPHEILLWLATNNRVLENNIKSAMDYYSMSQPIGAWSREQTGIGPVIAAGLMAHIDIKQAPTVGHIWRYAGLDPTSKWNKGEKRPWNASLKVLCWKIGESFVKVSNKEDATYGHIYKKRKEYEVAKNEAGDYKDQAEAILKRVPNHKQKKIYAEGLLPPGHIQMRSQRYAVKFFLAHWHAKAYEFEFGKKPPKPYPIEMLGHVHEVEPV